ncbi:MAG: hypothetical protein AB8E82_14195 [Aureispira sp.]
MGNSTLGILVVASTNCK